jgi:hypothetical protein
MSILNRFPLQLQLKQGVVANINTTATKNLAVTGEPHYTTDTKTLYIFDGTNNIPVVNKIPVTTTAINYTALETDNVIICTATLTVTLPAATGTGQTYRIVCRTGTTTIDASGSETIKGELTQTLSEGSDLIITDTSSGIWE